jgi:glycosyltransferase involved in cell wall biosynthesis
LLNRRRSAICSGNAFYSVKFSIVTPSYRQLDWLRLCIPSVADQVSGGLSVQHIIQDAGSPGIDDMKKSLPNFCLDRASGYELDVFVEKDEGMYDAVNRGLQRAQGDFCAYLNCDEQYLPGILRRVADFFAAHPDVDILFGDVVLIDATGRPVSYRRTTQPFLTHLRLASLNTLTCATFFRRHILDRGHFFPTHLKIAGDQLWLYQLLKEGVNTGLLHQPLAVFAFTGGNLSRSKQAEVERTSWLPSDEAISPAWMIQLAIALHRIRKLFAGAYRKRPVTVSLYTLESPGRRKTTTTQAVGFGWPH